MLLSARCQKMLGILCLTLRFGLSSAFLRLSCLLIKTPHTHITLLPEALCLVNTV